MEGSNQTPLTTALESFTKGLNYSLASLSVHHRNYVKMANQKKQSPATGSLKTPDREEIPVGEMGKCSFSPSINYRYQLYCLVLSFIMVHIIYYYLGFLFP